MAWMYISTDLVNPVLDEDLPFLVCSTDPIKCDQGVSVAVRAPSPMLADSSRYLAERRCTPFLKTHVALSNYTYT